VSTAIQKAEAAEREVKYRKRVYDRQVEAGKMTRDFADRQVAIMQEIADDYRKFAKTEQLI
jgi:hypothetical protein